jgi:hypothetical protein
VEKEQSGLNSVLITPNLRSVDCNSTRTSQLSAELTWVGFGQSTMFSLKVICFIY